MNLMISLEVEKRIKKAPNMVFAPYLVLFQDWLLVLGGKNRGYSG
jgi:hypothetical protein